MTNAEFKKQYQVEVDQVDDVAPDDSIKVIREIDAGKSLYYPNNSEADPRTQALRSGENIYLNLMMLARILYTIHNESDGLVDARIVARLKAQGSQSDKENRTDRQARKNNGENVDLKDIVACTLIIDRVHCSQDFDGEFPNTEIQGLYSERKQNLQLMETTVDFIKKMIKSVILPSDLYNKELTQEEKDEIIRQCDDILKNVNAYYDEEKSGEDEDKKEGKTPKKEDKKLKIDQYLIDMCTWLQDQKIAEKKEKLQKSIKKIKFEIKNEKNDDKKKRLQEKQNTFMNAMEEIKELERKNQKNSIIEEFEEIFEEDEELNLYTEIKNHLEEKKWTMASYAKQELSKEQLLSQLSIVTLYSLLKLQSPNPKSTYQGKDYNRIVAALNIELKEYKNCEIDTDKKGKKNKPNNMTYTDIRNLLWYVTQLNAFLSDKLQYEIIDYMMEQYSILSFMQMALGVDGFTREDVIKINGYLAEHYDFPIFEFKVTTDYRDKVMTNGTAAYGNRKKSKCG